MKVYLRMDCLTLVLKTALCRLVTPAGLHGLADDGRRQSASWTHTPRGARKKLLELSQEAFRI